MKIKSNGIQIQYEEFGTENEESILLIAGQSDPLTCFPTSFIERLSSAGYHIIIFDNRDSGLSDHVRSETKGDDNKASYTISDMAEDAIGLMNALDLKRPNIIGISMGGMIAQAIAVYHQSRIASITLMMTTPRANPETTTMLDSVHVDEDRFIRQALQYNSEYGGRKFQKTPKEAEMSARQKFRRNYDPQAANRQLDAARNTEFTDAQLEKIVARTLIIHGDEDRITPFEGAKRLANCITNSKLVCVPGMGHTISESLMRKIDPWIIEHIRA